MAGLNIDTEALNEAVLEAVMSQIDEQSKDAIIKAAIRSLNEPRGSRAFAGTPSRLQSAFDDAVYQAANQVAAELVKHDAAFRQAINEALRQALDKVVANSAVLQEAVGNAVTSLLRRDDL